MSTSFQDQITKAAEQMKRIARDGLTSPDPLDTILQKFPPMAAARSFDDCLHAMQRLRGQDDPEAVHIIADRIILSALRRVADEEDRPDLHTLCDAFLRLPRGYA